MLLKACKYACLFICPLPLLSKAIPRRGCTDSLICSFFYDISAPTLLHHRPLNTLMTGCTELLLTSPSTARCSVARSCPILAKTSDLLAARATYCSSPSTSICQWTPPDVPVWRTSSWPWRFSNRMVGMVLPLPLNHCTPSCWLWLKLGLEKEREVIILSHCPSDVQHGRHEERKDTTTIWSVWIT